MCAASSQDSRGAWKCCFCMLTSWLRRRLFRIYLWEFQSVFVLISSTYIFVLMFFFSILTWKRLLTYIFCFSFALSLFRSETFRLFSLKVYSSSNNTATKWQRNWIISRRYYLWTSKWRHGLNWIYARISSKFWRVIKKMLLWNEKWTREFGFHESSIWKNKLSVVLCDDLIAIPFRLSSRSFDEFADGWRFRDSLA